MTTHKNYGFFTTPIARGFVRSAYDAPIRITGSNKTSRRDCDPELIVVTVIAEERK